MMKVVKIEEVKNNTGKFRGAAHSICNLRYKVPENSPVVIHNASYEEFDQLAEEVKGELDCIGENIEKYITFFAPIKKKRDDGKTITKRLSLLIVLDL